MLIGGRNKDAIIQWVLKKSGPAAKYIQSQEEFQSFISSKSVTIVGYFENSELSEAKLFSQLADSTDDHPFGLISDYSKFPDVEHKNTFVLYKDVCFIFYYVQFFSFINVLCFSLTKRKCHSLNQSVTLKI